MKPGYFVLKDKPTAFNLRMPETMKSQLKGHAEQSGRSLNAEIVQRLRASLEPYRR